MKPPINPKVLKNVPPASAILFFQSLGEMGMQISRDRVEIKRIESAKEICLKEIEERHDTYRILFDAIFSERKEVIKKYFDLIDQGQRAKDRDIVLGAMSGLANLVNTSPFRDLDQLREVLDGDEVIEI